MRKATILLAEDDLDDQAFFFTFLKDRSDVELLPAAENGEEVLTLLDKSNGNLPDVLILDQNMPKMNGLQTLLAVRRDNRFDSLMLVVYSTYADESLIRQSLANGAALVLNKPTTASGYHRLIDHILEHKNALHQ